MRRVFEKFLARRILCMMTTKILFSVFLSLLLPVGATLAQQKQQNAPETSRPPDDQQIMTNFVFTGGGNYLGIYAEDVTKDNASKYGLRESSGVVVTEVAKDSPAERAGLKKGDVILRFDDELVTSARKLTRLINEAAPQHTTKLIIARNGAEQTLSATLGKREQLARDFNVAPFVQENVRRGLDDLNRNMKTFNFDFRPARRIGVSATPLTSQLADYFKVKGGVLVSFVDENSPAAKAGIKAGDVITQVDGQEISGVESLTRAISSKSEGAVTLTLVRDKKQRTVTLVPERAEQRPFNSPPMARNLLLPSINVPQIQITPLAPMRIKPVRPPAKPLTIKPLSPLML
jgi:membrane-associated protease RseP (regulator of RpoE activity)